MTAPPRTGARIVEATSPVLVLTTALHTVLVTACVSTWVTFLVGLVVGIVSEETGVLEGFDPLFRDAAGVLLITGFVLAVLTPAAAIVRRFALLPAVERLHGSDSEAVPPLEARTLLAKSPADGVRLAGTVLVWLGLGLVALFLLAIAVGGLWDNAAAWVLTACAGALFIVGVLLSWLGTALLRAFDPRMQALEKLWRRLVPTAVAREKIQRSRLPEAQLPRILQASSSPAMRVGGMVLAGVMGVGGIVLFASVYLRQPCRTCDERYWDEPVERGIDGLSLFGGTMLIIGAVALALVWAGFVVSRIRVERALLRWLDAAGPSRIDDERARALLTLPTALGAVAVTLAFLGTSTLIAAFALLAGDAAGAVPTGMLVSALALIVAAVLIELIGQRRQVRLRERLRDTTWPGDVLAEAEKEGART
ncbi:MULTISPECIES: hypothetical protein [unclassified Microbacterium]|uniref:hypothetical protein n=1 Tax=unclassified Microbacterium TaxID=2609290 RepID=UPI0012F895E3|nr:hypothetical protein [Microbacterium sp. MAH-37]MVQ42672.1 hypothetical protein [Microbacterium sp. MAH-37]